MHGMTQPATAEGYVEVEGGRIWYRVVGDGPGTPLITLHGGPGFPHDSLLPLAALADERPIVFYDQLGCGRSSRPTDVELWRVSRFVDELASLCKALALERYHVLGTSWGSMLATDFALSRPAGLASLVLANPCLSIPRWMEDAATLRAKLPEATQQVLTRHEELGSTDCPEYQAAMAAYYQTYMCRLSPWPDEVERSYAHAGMSVYRTMWGRNEFNADGTLSTYDRTDRLGEITVPTLFLCGRHDEATPEATQHYQSLVPDAQLMVFEDSAHMPHFEEPEAYLDTVRGFLAGVEAR